eukprot:gene31180-38527_t
MNSIHDNSLLNPEDSSAVAPVLALVNEVSTARLQPRMEGDWSELTTPIGDDSTTERAIEAGINFTANRATYFLDVCHPCRQRFTAAGRDFRYDKKTGRIYDPVVQSLYRRLQLANQLHACRDSCYKYCKFAKVKLCRYGFPKPVLEGNEHHAVIHTTKDNRSRLRIKVEPARNNQNLNISSANPLIALACRGNHDLQFMANSFGGAEYVSKENSERAAFALLLLHGVWGAQGEAGLLGECTSATERYLEVRLLDDSPNGGGFPKYVQKSLEKRIASETLLADAGTPLANDFNASTIEAFDEFLADEAEEVGDDPEFMKYTSAEEDEAVIKNRFPSQVIAMENVDNERAALEETIRTFNREQLHCFNAAQDCISGNHSEQMIMFVSGEGGTGKSFLIHALTKYTQILYGKSNFKKPFGGIHTLLAGKELSPLAQFTRLARVGKVEDPNVLAMMNQRVVNSMELAMKTAHSEADPRRPVTRLIAKHLPSKPGIDPPDKETRTKLYGFGGGAQSKAFNNKYTRYMLPIVPAHARTGHSVQGYTAFHGLVADVGSMFFAGDYVALSRARDIEDILILSPLKDKHFTSHANYRLLVQLEYQRLLRKFSQDFSSDYVPRGGSTLRNAAISRHHEEKVDIRLIKKRSLPGTTTSNGNDFPKIRVKLFWKSQDRKK